MYYSATRRTCIMKKIAPLILLALCLPTAADDSLTAEVEEAIGAGELQLIAPLHERITLMNRAIPSEYVEILNAASAVEDADVMESIAEMQAEVQAAMAANSAEDAIAAQEGVLLISQEMLGEEHWISIEAMRDLGYLFSVIGAGEEADAFYNEAMAMSAAVLGDMHPNTLQIAALIVDLLAAAGAVEDALAFNDMVIASYEEGLGAFHELTLDAGITSVTLLEGAGEVRGAAELMSGVCAAYDEGYGRFHPNSIICQDYLAGLANGVDLMMAEAVYQDIVDRLGASSTSIDTTALGALLQLGEIYRQQGRYQDSRKQLSDVLQLAVQMGETETSYTARSYLGRLFRDEGDQEKAQQVLTSVLEFGLVNWQDRPLQIYNTMLELGSVYQAKGLLAEAEATFEEAWLGLLETVGESHPSTLVAMNNLGQIYEKEGLYDLAEPILKQALSDMESVLGADNPQASRARNNLALLHESQGNFREAEPLYQRSLTILGQTLGEEHTDTIAVRNNLAFLYMLMEEFDQAAEMFTGVQQSWSVLFGEDHQSTLKATNNLGRVYQRLNRLPEAEQLVLRALELRQSTLGAEHIDSIRSMIDLGEIFRLQSRLEEADAMLSDAVSIAEDQLSEQHPYTFEALRNLARVKEARGQIDAAVDLRELGFGRRSVFLDRMLWVTGENAREGYLRLHRDELNEYLSLLTRIDATAGGRRAIDASLQRKGLLLKITSEIQQISKLANDPVMSSIAEELGEARRELAAMTLSGPTAETQGRHVAVLYALEQKVNELQGELGRASTRYRSSIAQVTVDSLAAEIPEDVAFVDYLTYEEDGVKKVLAGVAVNEAGEISFDLVVYQDRADVEDIIIEYRTIIQDDLADEDELLEIGQLAYESVWEPLEPALGDIEYVYLIPDGTLNILPFNALVNFDEEYLIQTHDLHLLTSGRDLLPNEYKLADGEYLIVAGPDYDSADVVSEAELNVAQGRRSAALKLGIRGVGGGLRGLSFAPLPGAEEEGRIITDQVEKNEALSSMFFAEQAQERVLSDIETPPEILHVATHGFFLEADDTLRNRILKAQRSADIHVPPPGDNPLLRAGLAFAGINNNAQFLGDIDTINDGVLTALEVLDLNLSGTRLVVLSACETGLGEIHEGEGVYGLRRSFQEAGVAEVVSSLWEVSDAGTQALMTDFYDRILQGTPARDALRETQLEMLDSPEWGYPYVWSAFMIVGSYESAGVTIQ
jgi:CHAT domain-containing protein/tetratricopeptide (TPR) repeat protein